MRISTQASTAIMEYSSINDLTVEIRKRKNTLFCTKLFDNLVVGPFIKDRFLGCPACVTTTLNQYREENILTVATNSNEELFEMLTIDDFELIQSIIEEKGHLNYLENYVQIINQTTGEIHNFKVVENEYCPVCSELIDDTDHLNHAILEGNTAKVGRTEYRTKKLGDLMYLFEKWNDYESGMFIHKYNDFRSTYINAVGIEVKAYPQFTVTGYGRNVTSENSHNIALLEAIERYCGLSNRKTRTNLYGSYNQLEHQYSLINPELFVLENGNSTYLDYSSDLEMYWVKGYSLKKQSEVYVPEQLAYYCDPEQLSIDRPNPSNRFVYDSSNGLALGSSRAEAVLHGLLEVIERDAFLNLWYSKELPERIDCSKIETKLDLVFQELKKQNIVIHFFKANKDIPVPCVVSLIENKNKDAKIKYYLAASSNFNPSKAIENAAFEVITSLPIFEEFLENNKEIIERYNLVKSSPKLVEYQDDHILYNSNDNPDELYQNWINQSNMNTIDELFGNNEFINETIESDLSLLVDMLSPHFEDIITIDETPTKIANEGFYAYKSVLLGAQPMYFGMKNKRISEDRITQYTNGRVEHQINMMPHPFP